MLEIKVTDQRLKFLESLEDYLGTPSSEENDLELLVLDALQYCHLPDYHAVFFFKQKPKIAHEKVCKILDDIGVSYNADKKDYKISFLSGAVIHFGKVSTLLEAMNWIGCRFNRVYFLDISSLKEEVYRLLCCRARPSQRYPNAPPAVRWSGVNPYGN